MSTENELPKDSAGNQPKGFDLDAFPDVSDIGTNLRKKDIIDIASTDVYGLYGLLNICNIHIVEDDPVIKTACITLNHNPEVFINAKFVNKFCKTNHHVLMIILHELLHKTLNHQNLFKSGQAKGLSPQLLNIAADAYINALLYQLYPSEKHYSFFKNLYETLGNHQRQTDPSFNGIPFKFLHAKARFDDIRHRYFYEGLYSPYGQDIDTIIKVIKESVPQQQVSENGDKVVGDHSGEGSALDEAARKAVSKILKKQQKTLEDKAEEYKKLLEARKKAEEEAKKKEAKGKKSKKEGSEEGKACRGENDPENREKTQDFSPTSSAFTKYISAAVELMEKQDSDVGSQLIKMAKQSTTSKVIVAGKRMFPKIPLYTPKPNFKQKARVISHVMGRYRPYDKNPVKPVDFGRCHCYIDVSGSMGTYVDDIYKILQGLREVLADKIHLFSTEIRDITRAEFCQSVVETTWGTDFNVIFEHALQNKIDKMIIFTDGYADLDKKWIQKAKQMRMQIITVFTPDRSDNNPLISYGICKETYTFNEKMGLSKDSVEGEKVKK